MSRIGLAGLLLSASVGLAACGSSGSTKPGSTVTVTKDSLTAASTSVVAAGTTTASPTSRVSSGAASGAPAVLGGLDCTTAQVRIGAFFSAYGGSTSEVASVSRLFGELARTGPPEIKDDFKTVNTALQPVFGFIARLGDDPRPWEKALADPTTRDVAAKADAAASSAETNAAEGRIFTWLEKICPPGG